MNDRLSSRRPLPNPSVHQLEYLIAAADAPTRGDAAAAVGVSASALSQGLTELERRVGLTLFRRDGRRQMLRRQAEPVLDHARRVLALTADLQRYVEATLGGLAGQIRVGMIDVAAVDHFPSVLHGLRLDRPELELHLTVGPSGGLFADLAEGRIDLVVGVEPQGPIDGVTWVDLIDEPLYVYVAESATQPSHILAEPGRWGPWVSFPEGSHTRRLIAGALQQKGAVFDVVAESHQPEVLREMVSLGLGWTALPAVQAEKPPVTLRRVGGEPLVSRTLVAAWRESAVTPTAALTVRDSLLAASATMLLCSPVP